MLNASGFLKSWEKLTRYRVGGDCAYGLSTRLIVPFAENLLMNQDQLDFSTEITSLQHSRSSTLGSSRAVKQSNGRLGPKAQVLKAFSVPYAPSIYRGASSETLPAL